MRTSDQRGAMMVMGIPIAFLMIAMLYFTVGVGEQVVMRERLQDAADAGAFSAAIMHARGMNMIALVNQVMAAIVALLVMVRLLQVLMLATSAIASALAFWTGGASLAVVPPAMEAAAQAENAFNQLKNVTTPILRALHVFELGVKYAMPVAAEARVVDTVRGHYNPPASVGFAIPGSYPLPVVDGKWSDLCGKAGEYAGNMITWPIDAIIGDNIVSDFIGDGVEGMARSFSGLFCDPNSAAEGLTVPAKPPPIELDKPFTESHPMLDSLRRCKSKEHMDRSERDRVCDEASREEARSQPGPDGGPNTTCSYLSPTDQSMHGCEPCRGSDGSACDEFMFKVQSAANECSPGGGLAVATWSYQRRDFSWRVNLVPVPLVQPSGEGEQLEVPEPEDWPYTIEFVSEEPAYRDSFVREDGAPPCGPNGRIGGGYREGSTYHEDGKYADGELLCQMDHFHPDAAALTVEAGPSTAGLPLREWRARFAEAHWSEQTEDYEPARPADLERDAPWPPAYLKPPYVPEQRPFFVGAWSAVTFLHSCGTTVDSMDDVDMQDAGDAEPMQDDPPNTAACGQGKMIHHVMEPGHELGDETFQLRAVVIGDSDREAAKDIVRRMPFRLAGEGRGGDGGLHGAVDLVSKVFVAQAEYYYDTTWDEGRKRVSQDADQWLWNMSWRARLRRFRLPADSDSSGGGEGKDAGGCGFEAPAADVGESCSATGADSCPDDSGGFLSGLGDLAESVLVH